VTWPEAKWGIEFLAKQLGEAKIWGVPRNGSVAAAMMTFQNPFLQLVDKPTPGVIIVDLVCDTGATLRAYQEKGFKVVAAWQRKDCPLKLDATPLIYDYDKQGEWLLFPWEHGTFDNPEIPKETRALLREEFREHLARRGKHEIPSADDKGDTCLPPSQRGYRGC